MRFSRKRESCRNDGMSRLSAREVSQARLLLRGRAGEKSPVVRERQKTQIPVPLLQILPGSLVSSIGDWRILDDLRRFPGQGRLQVQQFLYIWKIGNAVNEAPEKISETLPLQGVSREDQGVSENR
ncbi:uncharacterized protein LOC143306508 [Osmia lignaria lignaria]|uniref:uncharacterized protein LOC117611469 n=1 Tax=Osmia lignaria TaxID=473952 RepID=UPI001478569B|nr:uncharacterized protein LOC117611469 [Osmia lignaria]XP_034195311.1 uncharacterized protein LOC117611469 [Osmia lignaria]